MTTTREQFNNRPIYSLSDIANSLEAMIEKTYSNAYYIKAEILKLNIYPHSNHCYPELVEKENNKIKAQMRAIIWKTQYDYINQRFLQIAGEPLKENITILCLATIKFSPQYGLALHIQDIEPIYTLGEMAKNKNLVIEKLKKENVFSLNKQKILPLVPKRIAVISVETSKGYHDFMVTLEQNSWNYAFQCTLYHSILQGDKAITTITQRLEEIELVKNQYDCVVIVRGGGGDVGLSCYDDYKLAHQVATFPLPIITGIGHSTNETITDMVAYANKITPTDVAYFLIQKFHDFAIQLEECKNKIFTHSLTILKEEKNKINIIEINRKFMVAALLDHHKKLLDQNIQLIPIYSKQLFSKQHDILNLSASKIELLDPKNILKRGFSITYFNGKAIADNTLLKKGDQIETKFYNGTIISKVE